MLQVQKITSYPQRPNGIQLENQVSNKKLFSLQLLNCGKTQFES